MPSLGWKKKLVSASLVALGATGVTLGGAAAAHADTMIGLYDTQAQCLAVKVVYQSNDPGGSYYCDNDHEAGVWYLWKR
ncbi:MULTISPECIES: hypothetical protein [Streptomyces]|uniref:Secreted protein n=1 Tax=Streptomyces tendae TaxID=1932 RepID=A0A6B3QW83_STRTE|nr:MULTISPECIES: hypothetical protein [Streptomyces]MBQ0965945.1 hypothetical protein [Streptomyces sp. RK74B]MBQ1005823.1 hypothetical protein [Streptomyces sp. RK23]NEV91928.1 hypothetical protein [Streptomyces tendae]BET52129.1 hypothetical protein RGQ21_71110 [Kitasatospora aureofaciens]